MFSAFKRLAGKTDGSGHGYSRPAHQSMPTTLQKKFAKGVQYNMKIIIKGDRNVGKTCLFQRLQGQKFIEEYIPTEEIQVTSIQWNYKATDDIVKVEVWDVVDRGRRRKKIDGLKMDNVSSEEVIEEPTLDAEFLDVYKGTNGVIIMMDITKSWTFDYIQRELPKIPNHIPIIVLGNHCDMSHHRTITADHVTYFIDTLHERTAQVRYAETSMRNGFGLKLLHKFFNLPFLQLQRETLLKQLDTNTEETRLTIEELDLYQESEDADYDKFLDNLVNKRRAFADSVSINTKVSNAPSLNNQHVISSNCTVNAELRRSTLISGPVGGGNPIQMTQSDLKLVPKQENILSVTSKTVENSIRHIQNVSKITSVQIMSKVELTKVADISVNVQDRKEVEHVRPQSIMSKIFRNKKDEEAEGLYDTGHIKSNAPLTNVEDFVPDDGQIDRSFLEDTNQISIQKVQHEQVDSESEIETANPLVAEYEDDLSSADEVSLTVQPETTKNSFIKQKQKYDSILDTAARIQDNINVTKRDSVSSIEKEFCISKNFLISEHQEVNSDSLDSWLQHDSKWRQSPEGGEDMTNANTKKDKSELSDKSLDTSVTSSNVHLELLDTMSLQHVSSNGSSPVMKEKKKHKDKSEDKEKKKKKKSKDKEKTREKGDRSDKKKKRSFHRPKSEDKKRDELEEFLTGSPLRVNIDVAYEAI